MTVDLPAAPEHPIPSSVSEVIKDSGARVVRPAPVARHRRAVSADRATAALLIAALVLAVLVAAAASIMAIAAAVRS